MEHSFEDVLSLPTVYAEAFTCYYNLMYNDASTAADKPIPAMLQSIAGEASEGYRAMSDAVKAKLSTTGRAVETLLCCFKMLATYIERSDLFSSNEEMDDIQTENVKYLLTPFILGHLCASTEPIEMRLARLKESVVHFQEFLDVAERLKLARKVDVQAFQRDVPADPTTVRNEKIERSKYEKKLSAQIERLLVDRRKKYSDEWTWGKHGDEDEEAERSLFLTLHSRFTLDAISQIDLVKQEIPLLEMRLKEASEPSNERRPTKPKPLRKPWTYTIKSSAEIREAYRQSVFQPFHNLPTISLAEFADTEMRLAREREEREKKAANREIDEKEEEERKELEDREWDDWKDDNPKGSGNRNRNIG